MKQWKTLCLATLAMLLVGCGVNQDSYQFNQPYLDLATFFDGRIVAWGSVHNRSGEQIRRFKVTIDGSWEGNQGRLDERFIFDDGERQQRIWTIQKNGDNYVGTADDVVGEALGTVKGNSLHWKYTVLLPVGDKTYEIAFDDWMYLIDDKSMFNRAKMKKFGFRVGEIFIFFTREGAEEAIEDPFPSLADS